MLSKPTSCSGCPLYDGAIGKKYGFSLPDGEMTGGVAIVAEALGADEEAAGQPLVGKSGYALFQQLKRVDIEREQFRILNVISCRPPDNKLVGMWYEKDAITHCSPILDTRLIEAREIARGNNQTFTIVCLGVTAFKRVMGLDSKKDANLLRADYWGYPFWSATYSAWVFAAPHPAFLLRGNTHLWPVVQFVFTRALEVARDGLKLYEEDYTLDPATAGLDYWIRGYEDSLTSSTTNPLSYDIETPYKKKKDEAELGQEDDADHTILRISFAYERDGKISTVSVKWSTEFLAGIERLFKIAPFVLGWNSDNYDSPRVKRHVEIKGVGIDGMVAWHILNTSLPKGLGFVTPYYVQNTTMWKHLSEEQPAFYNAKDADMALRNYLGIKIDLEKHKLWHVFERHVLELNQALKYMSDRGVLRDNLMRQEAEDMLSAKLEVIEARMEEAVPVEARKYKVYKKAPKDTQGMVLGGHPVSVKYCRVCGLLRPTKAHTKLCPESTPTVIIEQHQLWAKPLEFKISKVGLTSYQKALKHQAIVNWREKKVTFNEDAITRLMKQHPKDPLYPNIIEHRKTQKLLSTYIGVTQMNGTIRGGMDMGIDGRIHTTYSHNPSTLRLASENPNMQNLPRPSKDKNDPVNIIRNLIVAAPGNVLYARDFSGIEAVLTFYFAACPSGVRLSRQDVHTYYTMYALHELEGRFKSYDLPDISWPDERLFPYLTEMKEVVKTERNTLYKHLVHAANFMQSPKGAAEKIFSETGIDYPIKTVAKVMDVYFALFPEVRRWHTMVLGEAEKDGYLRNPFDYVHRFSHVYSYTKECGEWAKKPNPSVANKVVAFKPQSTASGIIKESILRMFQDRYEECGKYLRLQVHDENLFEVPLDKWEELDLIAKEEMERPIPQLPLPESWGMGSNLSILTEAKVDLGATSRWGSMKGIKDK